MSLLSSTQGTPEYVWALVSLLRAAKDCRLSRLAVCNFLLPPDGNDQQTRVSTKDCLHTSTPSIIDQVLGAARSLNLITSVKDEETLVEEFPFLEISELADYAHQHLAGEKCGEADSVLLKTYAWFIVKSEQGGGEDWLAGMTTAAIADLIDKGLREGDDERTVRVFNPTKIAPWTRWMTFLGLTVESKAFAQGFYTFASDRLGRELKKVALKLGLEGEHDAEIVLRELRTFMPYIDGGTTFNELASKMKWQPPPKTLSRVLSEALRELQDRRMVRLLAPGDTHDAFRLSPDPLHLTRHLKTLVFERSLLDV